MKISTFPDDWALRKQQSSPLDAIARNALFRILRSLTHGHITLQEKDQHYQFGDAHSELRANIVVTNPSFYRMVLLNGSIGAGEAYISGSWYSENLTKVVQVICRNMQQLEKIDGGFSSMLASIDRVKRACIPNSLSGSRKNIQAHYDLSNELFQLFLDTTMMYSSAIYKTGRETLEQAQQDKLEALSRKLDIDQSHSVIEIGSGWGAMAIHLAEHYGCRVTTTTISQEQYEYTRKRVKSKGLCNLITVLDKDYRQLTGRFDRLISIEMIEAVGHQYMPDFFKKCSSLLKNDGKMVLQAITIPEQRYDYAKRNVDFIQKYIFPGGFLPSIKSMLDNTGKYTRLQIESLDDIGLDYAQTLHHWQSRFINSKKQVFDLNFDKTFTRLWEFYLSYCEGGFRERSISAVQVCFRNV